MNSGFFATAGPGVCNCGPNWQADGCGGDGGNQVLLAREHPGIVAASRTGFQPNNADESSSPYTSIRLARSLR